jgi:hypothetical protein
VQKELIEISPDSGLTSFEWNQGFILVDDLRYTATTLNLQVVEWNVIQDWLGCKGREFNEADKSKINKAWESYEAAGIAPSIALQETFDNLRASAINNRTEIINIPSEVKNVFDHLLATETEIRRKRVYDAALKNIKDGKSPDSKSSFLANMKNTWKTNPIVRRYCFGAGCWIIAALVYPLLREDSYYRYNDVLSSENHYLKIALLPPLFFGIALYVYKRFIK